MNSPMSRGDSSLVGGMGTASTAESRREERGSLSVSGRRHHSISIMNSSQKVSDASVSTKRSGSGTLTTTIEAFASAIESQQQSQIHLVEDSAENSEDEDHDTLDIYGKTVSWYILTHSNISTNT